VSAGEGTQADAEQTFLRSPLARASAEVSDLAQVLARSAVFETEHGPALARAIGARLEVLSCTITALAGGSTEHERAMGVILRGEPLWR
jgi:hypothetical protein